MRWTKGNKPSCSLSISHRTQTQAHYCLRKNVSVLGTLIWMISDPDTHNENAYPKLQTRAPRTNATQQLPTSCLSTLSTWLCRTFVLEAWRWHGQNNSDQEKIFSWGRGEEKGIESPLIKDTMKIHALRKPNIFSLH